MDRRSSVTFAGTAVGTTATTRRRNTSTAVATDDGVVGRRRIGVRVGNGGLPPYP
jgi:hypothetical protein